MACHQWHPPGLPPVGDPSECPHHDLEVGGGLPTSTGVRADSRPPPHPGRGGGPPLPLRDAGPGYATLGSLGYTDDTQTVAPGAASLQGTVPATEEWLQITRQNVRVDKSCSWVQGERGAPAILLSGVPIPPADTFRQLGADIAIGGSRVTRPVLSRRPEAG